MAPDFQGPKAAVFVVVARNEFSKIKQFCSIKSYYYNDDVFNFDYGQAKAAVGNYQVAFKQIVKNLSTKFEPIVVQE